VTGVRWVWEGERTSNEGSFFLFCLPVLGFI
jgi:hypothetical protein